MVHFTFQQSNVTWLVLVSLRNRGPLMVTCRSDVAPPTEQSHPDLNRARSAQQKEESEFNRKALAALIDN